MELSSINTKTVARRYTVYPLSRILMLKKLLPFTYYKVNHFPYTSVDQAVTWSTPQSVSFIEK